MLRDAFAGSPAYMNWNSMLLQMHDDWTAEEEDNTTDRKTNLQGLVGKGFNYRLCKISAKPIATSVNLATLIAKLHTIYLASNRGEFLSTLLGGSDLPAVIQGKHGRAITFAAAFLTKMPDVTFAPNVDLFDNFELTCLLADEGSSASLEDFVTEDASAYTEPTLDPLTIISKRFNLSWGTTEPFDDIEVDEKGIKLRPSLNLTERMTQKDGLLNWQLESKTAEVSFTPVNLDSQDFVSLLPAVGRGSLLGTAGLALNVEQITGSGGPKLVVPCAVPTKKPLLFGTGSRYGEVVMSCERKVVTSVLQEPYTLSVKA